eukprot:1738028-Rhodomonas_salina.2
MAQPTSVPDVAARLRRSMEGMLLPLIISAPPMLVAWEQPTLDQSQTSRSEGVTREEGSYPVVVKEALADDGCCRAGHTLARYVSPAHRIASHRMHPIPSHPIPSQRCAAHRIAEQARRQVDSGHVGGQGGT